MRQIKIVNQTQALPGELWAGYCATFLCRLRGLSFRRSLPNSQGLLLVQSRESRIDAAIHMFFMRFDIAVIWLDETKTVVDVQKAHRWRSIITPRIAARYVLEAPTFWMNYFSIGDHLSFEETNS